MTISYRGYRFPSEGTVNLMVAGERRPEPRDRRDAYAAVLTAVMSAQTTKAWVRAARY